MKRLITAAALLCGVAGPVHAQAGLRLEGVAGVTGIETLSTPQGERVSAASLSLFGATLRPTADGWIVVLLGDTLVFRSGSPVFTAGRDVVQLAHEITAADGMPLLPAQFFREWLPARWPDRFAFREGTLRVQGVVTARPPADPRPRLVVLDPGHGGRDSGKIGPNRLHEKDAALQVSRRIADALTRRGIEVQLTRTADTLVALADRPRLANRWKAGRPAAVFVSIHMNSTTSTSARGFETFFLSAARTDDERRVAEMENAAAEFDDGPSIAFSEEDLILNGLRNDFYVRASNDLAEAIQRSIARVHDGPDRGVKRAGFRVLVGALMPAVLVEVGFISNPQEARRLGDPAFQAQVATAITDAIETFFVTHEHLWTGS